MLNILEFVDNLFINIANLLRSFIQWTGINDFWTDFFMIIVYFAGIIIVMMGSALVLVLAERKIAGYTQLRPGPNRVGPWGIFQTVADAIKLLTKEDIMPKGADKIVFTLAPILVLIPAILAFVVIPFGNNIIASDLDIGIFYLIAVSSLSTLPFLMAGWSSNNKYSLLGGMRAVAQMISYEVPMVFSLLGVVMLVGSLKMSAIADAQSGLWFIFFQPIAFIIYVISATAECNRAPFDIPEGESEIVAGMFTEYTGMKWALFFLAEYANLVLVSAVAVTMFFGGWNGPVLPGWIWVFIKVCLMLFFFMWIRWTFPRVRVDHLMSFGWKFLVPLSLVNIFLTGIGIYFFI